MTPEEEAAKRERHERLIARQKEEARLRAVAREVEKLGSIKAIERLGKKVGKKDQARKRLENVRKDISRRGKLK